MNPTPAKWEELGQPPSVFEEEASVFSEEMVEKILTSERERLAKGVEGMRIDIPTRQIHNKQLGISNTNRRISRWGAENYNQALSDILAFIRQESP